MDLAAIVIGSIIGVAGIVAAIVIAKRQQQRISVDFDILSDIRLIESDAGDSFANRIEVTYDSRPLRYPRIVDVKVTNTGNTPVSAGDYERPIVIELDGGYSPIDATVMAESTENITGDIFETQPNGVRAISLRPPLLNRGDWFTLRILFDNNDSPVTGSHRIVGGLPMRQYTVELDASQAKISRHGLWLMPLALVFVGTGCLIGGVTMAIILWFYAAFIQR